MPINMKENHAYELGTSAGTVRVIGGVQDGAVRAEQRIRVYQRRYCWGLPLLLEYNQSRCHFKHKVTGSQKPSKRLAAWALRFNHLAKGSNKEKAVAEYKVFRAHTLKSLISSKPAFPSFPLSLSTQKAL